MTLIIKGFIMSKENFTSVASDILLWDKESRTFSETGLTTHYKFKDVDNIPFGEIQLLPMFSYESKSESGTPLQGFGDRLGGTMIKISELNLLPLADAKHNMKVLCIRVRPDKLTLDDLI
ncbi:MAG: hypothetical protein U9N61_00815 [Euryarchaeota archaeon]|nr:hypothetical protein [Euryarchaeota archaeon]